MAYTLSDLLSNRFTPGAPKNSASVEHGRMHISRCRVVSAAADAAGHLYPLFRVSAYDCLHQLFVTNTPDAGWSDINVGVYAGDDDGQTSPPDWTVRAPTLITSCQDVLVDGENLALGSAGKNEILGTGTNAYGETLEGLPLWQMCQTVSRAPQPGTKYDIVLHTVGDPAGGGTMIWKLVYAAGD